MDSQSSFALSVLSLISIAEFKRCYLLRCYESGTKPQPPLLEYLSSLENPSGKVCKQELNLYGYGLTDETVGPLLFALSVLSAHPAR